MVVGKACFEDGRISMYAYVHRQVQSAAARLDRFLAESGVDKKCRVTIVVDGAGEFEKAVRGARQPMCRVLDWFHIVMKVRATEVWRDVSFS